MIYFYKNMGTGAPKLGRFLTVIRNVNMTGHDSYSLVLKSPFKYSVTEESKYTGVGDVTVIKKNCYALVIAHVHGKWRLLRTKSAIVV